MTPYVHHPVAFKLLIIPQSGTSAGSGNTCRRQVPGEQFSVLVTTPTQTVSVTELLLLIANVDSVAALKSEFE